MPSISVPEFRNNVIITDDSQIPVKGWDECSSTHKFYTAPNGEVYKIVAIKEYYYSNFELIGRRFFGGLLVACTLGIAYLFRPVKELFKESKIRQYIKKDDYNDANIRYFQIGYCNSDRSPEQPCIHECIIKYNGTACGGPAVGERATKMMNDDEIRRMLEVISAPKIFNYAGSQHFFTTSNS